MFPAWLNNCSLRVDEVWIACPVRENCTHFNSVFTWKYLFHSVFSFFNRIVILVHNPMLIVVGSLENHFCHFVTVEFMIFFFLLFSTKSLISFFWISFFYFVFFTLGFLAMVQFLYLFFSPRNIQFWMTVFGCFNYDLGFCLILCLVWLNCI